MAYRRRTRLMLIPSRRQIDSAQFGAGYLGWTTSEFAEYVRARDPERRIELCRDHGGPWMNSREAEIASPSEALDSCMRSFSEDIAAGFDLLHIDTSEEGSGAARLQVAIDRLTELYRRCWMESCRQAADVAYEIGFEPQGVSTNDPDEFKAALRQVLDGIDGIGAPRPRFVVAQTGTKVAEIGNVGRFHQPEARAETLRAIGTLAAISHEQGLRLKAHNCDYLSPEEAALLIDAGVDAFNVAPEFGVVETRSLLRVMDELELDKAKEEFLALAFDSLKWQKWMLDPTTAGDVERAVIAGHYVFRAEAGLRIREEVEHELARRGCPALDRILREPVVRRIESHLSSLSLSRRAAR
ncbi:class II D-tagatose-bisphosphate aldolase, non-catalytic subunit [Wenjunlia tyrosinilytica]|uniref:class II D-tagatose-bisphosphate aldolase, non-catalytic subunit n=1 Tax=Wenjunlia tyrosinilytica TaxID=1544741 RepID=UPI001E47E3FA|nr:class II D-tagatose-bisphosphate aldolase, non-catalytic subunit [Wenjunlia tyrosinilytica]